MIQAKSTRPEKFLEYRSLSEEFHDSVAQQHHLELLVVLPVDLNIAVMSAKPMTVRVALDWSGFVVLNTANRFRGSEDAGKRLKDVVELCSQAVRSAKWKWRFRELCRHLLGREKRLQKPHRPTRLIAGDAKTLNHFLRLSRFKDLRVEIAIVQPGLSQTNCTAEQSSVLAAADSFLIETVDTPMTIVCCV